MNPIEGICYRNSLIGETTDVNLNNSATVKTTEIVQNILHKMVPSNHTTKRLMITSCVLLSLLTLAEGKTSYECAQQCERSMIPSILLALTSFPVIGPFALIFLATGGGVDENCMNNCS